MQLNESFYRYTLHQQSQDPSPFPWPTPKQFRATVALSGDRLNIQTGAGPVVMEACLWGFYGGWIFKLQWGPLMVIFHHGDAAEDKGKEVRGGTIH